MTQQIAITTVDNPYDPFTKFDEWFAWDRDRGYHTCGYLARIMRTSDELSIADQDLALEYAIDEIIQEDVLGLYKKVAHEKEKVSESSES